jgi:GxxExxY protein
MNRTTDGADNTDKKRNALRFVFSYPCYPRHPWLFSLEVTMSPDLIHKELSEAIIGAAMEVLNALKPGLDEKLYERALAIELRKRGHLVETQREFPVFYDSQHIGSLIPDLIVDNQVIADPKVVTSFQDTHFAQMLGYLNITGLRLALLLNFKHARLEWKRVVK